MSRSDSRERMVGAAAALFQRQGYRATSWRQVVDEGDAPWGSVAYLFPGGKEQLGVEAVTLSGERVAALVQAVAERAGDTADVDPVAGVRAWVEACAQVLERSGWVAGCPVATVVLEVGATNEAIRVACSEAFDRWGQLLAERLRAAGLDESRAEELGTVVLCMVEGGLIVARARRSTVPLQLVADEVERMLRHEIDELNDH